MAKMWILFGGVFLSGCVSSPIGDRCATKDDLLGLQLQNAENITWLNSQESARHNKNQEQEMEALLRIADRVAKETDQSLYDVELELIRRTSR